MELEAALGAKAALRDGQVRLPGARGLGQRLLRRGHVPAGVALGVAVYKDGADYGVAVRLTEVSRGTREYAARVAALYEDTDILEIGPVRPRTQSRSRPLAPGWSIGAVGGDTGTLGAGVTCRRTGRVGVLSNSHVLPREGAAVLQPSAADGGRQESDRIGAVERIVELSRSSLNRADAALCLLDNDVDVDHSQLFNGIAADALDLGDAVSKTGRSTGLTEGVVSVVRMEIGIEYEWGVVDFENVFEVAPAGGAAFSADGDSGAVVHTATGRRAVGLLFAGTEGAGALTYCNPIADVLEALDTDLLEAGHG